MPIINSWDPLDDAAGAIGSYEQTSKDNKAKALALAYARSRDQRADMESDRNYDLAKGEAADSHQLNEAQIAHDHLQDQIAQAQEDAERLLRPIAQRSAELGLQIQQGAIAANAAELRAKNIANDTAAVQLRIAKTYGLQTAQLAVQQAKASLAQTAAQTAATEEGTRATRIGEQATLADIARTNKETSLLGTGGYGGYGGGRRGSKGQFDLEGALSQLSPVGQKAYENLYQSNQLATPQQALLAIRNPRNTLTAKDREILSQIVMSKDAGLATPRQQQSEANADRNFDYRRDRSTTGDSQRASKLQYAAIAQRNPAFQKLRPDLRALVEHMMVQQGGSPDQIISELRPIASGQEPAPDGFSQEDAAAMMGALGGR